MTKELAVVNMDDAAITAALQGRGLVQETPQNYRMKIDGSTFIAGDEVYLGRKDEPAFTARLVGPVAQYQAFYFTQDAAQIANRPDIADQFCKSFFDIPEQARRHAEDGTACGTCPFMPFIKDPPFTGEPPAPRKCQWRGDIGLQIIPESGQLAGDEPIWTLSLSTTGIIEFVGTGKNPTAGSVSDYNFMHKLARLGTRKTPENPMAGLAAAIEAYNAGMVVVEGRLLTAQNASRSQTWRVPSFEPIEFFAPEATDTPAAIAAEVFAEDLADGEPRNVTPAESDQLQSDLPF